MVVRDVVVWAAVNDRRGRPELDLGLADFQVYEDGVRQEITSFDVGLRAPLHVEILMDASRSMALSGGLDLAKRIAFRILGKLRAQDEVSLWFFSGRRTYHDCAPGTPRERVAEAVAALGGFGETAMRDSVLESLLAPAAASGARRAVFLLSDGDDNASRISEEELSAVAASLNVAVHAIILSPKAERDIDPSAHAGLKTAVELSGGTFVIVSPYDEESPLAAVDSAINRLRSSYVMEYTPEGPLAGRHGFHRIEVKTRCKRCTVLHRQGYYTR